MYLYLKQYHFDTHLVLNSHMNIFNEMSEQPKNLGIQTYSHINLYSQNLTEYIKCLKIEIICLFITNLLCNVLTLTKNAL